MLNKSHLLRLTPFVFVVALIIIATTLLIPAAPTLAAPSNGSPNHERGSLVNPYRQSFTGNLISEGISPFSGMNHALRSPQYSLQPGVLAALDAFYTSTNGATWTNNTGWVGGSGASDPCTWYGVTCDTNGLLTKIIMHGNGLTGTLPPEIGDFTDLTILDLLSNQITGSIPTQIGNLSNLTVLDLSANQFSGSLPTELEKLSNLGNLYTYANQLTGPIPTSLGNLSNLGVLEISDNHFNGSIPSQLGNLTLLVDFSLQNNDLTGTIPDLSALTFLNTFRIDGNLITGSLPAWLFSNTNMKIINLNKNQLTGSIPASLGSLTKLQDFQVAYNQLSGEIPAGITGLTHLNIIYTSFNMLTTSNSAVKTLLDTKNPGWDQTQTIAPGGLQIGKVTSASVEINWDSILYTANGGNYQVSYATTTGGPYSAGCPTADKTVTSCIVNGLTPETTYFFVVQSFTPAHDDQQNALLSSYSQEVTTSTFPVTICDSTSEIPYSECQALWLLYTNDNGANWTNHTDWLVTNTTCSWYGVTCNTGHVTQLALGGNNLIGTLPHEISYLTSLQSLSLGTNGLTGAIPTQISSLVALQHLDLSANDLSGSIPTQLGSLSLLVDVNLSGNQLSGSVPSQLGGLSALQTLILNENKLSGGIPLQLGSLTNLLTLNLANNALIGSIPAELGNLTNVTLLDISFNALTASDANLITWLNSKQPTWASTQTVPPTGIQTAVLNTNTIRVSWTPITYTSDGGYYEVGYSTNINGPFSQSGCTTADKIVTTCDVHNLGYNTAYYFAVRTSTSAHGVQQNVLLSGFSAGVIGTTPTNDNFVNSVIIPKPPYSNTLSNNGATLEALEQKGACEGTSNIQKSIWYQYKALGTENVTFTVSGSTVVKGISIWTGTGLGSLTQVGCGIGATAAATTTTIYGITYYVRIGTSNGVVSPLTLQVTTPQGAPLRNGFSTQTPTLTWNRITNATRYEIQVSKVSTFTTLVFPLVSVPANQLSYTTPTLTEGIYYWRVRVIRGTTAGAWSAFDTFVVERP